VKNSTPKNIPQSGFALVIALSLMAFVLVLILSITTLVQVETRSAETQISSLEARQNALLALKVALGELQKSTGPDQRVTARADIFDTDPDTEIVDGVANSHWLGVYQAVEPNRETQPLEALRNWATNRSVANRVNWLVSSRTDLSAAGLDPVTTDAVELNGGDPANVITMARFEDSGGALQDVFAGKVDIAGLNDKVDGQYAWWVSDESAKFRINATKELTVLNNRAFEPRWALMAPQQSNPSLIPELASFNVSDTIQQDRLRRSSSVSDFQMLVPDWSDSSVPAGSSISDWLALNSDDFTLVSESLPVDVTQGRLKEDLTVYLETNVSGLNDSDFIVRGGSNDLNYEGRLGNSSFDVNYAEYNLPRFGLMKSWYETGMNFDGFVDIAPGGVAQLPRSHSPEQHGLHPVIIRSAVYFGLSYQIVGEDIYPVFLVYPKFTLWNPHNVPIAPAKYVVQVRARTALNTQYQSQWAAHNVTQNFSYKGYNNLGALRPQGTIHFNWANPANPKGLVYEDDDGDGSVDNPYLTFTIDNDGFAPGETLLYSANLTDPSNPSASEYVDNQGVNYLSGNSSSSDLENHNLLINADTDNIGFFYIVSNSFMRADPNTFASGATGITNLNDELRAQFFVSDTDAGLGFFEPSLSTKLWHLDEAGSAELLEFLDLAGSDTNTRTPLDWDASNQSLEFVFEEFSDSMSLDGTPNYEWGFGYFARPMGNDNTNLFRNFNRFNYLSPKKHVDDPSNTSPNFGRLYGASDSTRNWFDGTYPSSIPGPEYQNSISFDGYDSLGAYGLFHHHTTPSHGTVYPLYDYVRDETGLLSLGYLANVSFATNHYQASFPFGNSEAHTHIDRVRAYQSRTGFSGPLLYSDLSYVLNESIWDRFFVSTIPQDNAIPVGVDSVLPNTRHRIVNNFDGTAPSDSDLRASNAAFESVAANVSVEGGFNINSTSKIAWQMLLSSLLGESVSSADGVASNSLDRVPVSKRVYPLLGEVLDAGIASIKPDSPYAWSSTRSLSAVEIERLAEALVAEVKRRGPFLSVADFVNRRLVPNAGTRNSDFFGLKGTMQTAIDKVSTDPVDPRINNEFYTVGEHSGGRLSIESGNAVENILQAEHERGMPGDEAGSRMFGAPAFLTQADVFSALAPLLTVRGDTFIIRTYGESKTGLGNSVGSRAWCEAVVQRVAAPLDQSDAGGVVQPQGAFGRQFKVVSIRWIDQSRIL
jgi:hypothetical protein